MFIRFWLWIFHFWIVNSQHKIKTFSYPFFKFWPVKLVHFVYCIVFWKVTGGFSREWLIFKSASGPGGRYLTRLCKVILPRRIAQEPNVLSLSFRPPQIIVSSSFWSNFWKVTSLYGIQNYPLRRNCKRKWNKWIIPVIQVLFLENRHFSFAFVKNTFCKVNTFLFKYPHFFLRFEEILLWNGEYYDTTKYFKCLMIS